MKKKDIEDAQEKMLRDIVQSTNRAFYKLLNPVVDKVLAYKPKAKSAAAKKRKRHL